MNAYGYSTHTDSAMATEAWGKWSLARLNAYSFGLAGFVLAMDTAVLPILVLDVAPEAAKNTLLGVSGVGRAGGGGVGAGAGWLGQ